MARFDRLTECFDYDPDTGVVLWRWRDPESMYHNNGWNDRFAGKEAGANRKGYLYVSLDGQQMAIARVAWALHHKINYDEVPPIVDHRNRNTLDNRIKNLRAATKNNNNHNQGMKRNNKSGVKGVSISPKNKSHPYRAHIMAYGKQKERSFKTMEEAIEWRERQVEIMHGAFGCSIRKEVDDGSL